MKIEKYIKAKIEREYFFVKGNLPIDCKYFIKKIDESEFYQHDTNVIGKMTWWDYFLNDKNFIETIILPLLDVIDDENFAELGDLPYGLNEAWGFREDFSEYTRKHHHLPSFLSGAVMLTNHSQDLHFTDINQKLESKPGNFVLFSSFLNHRNYRNLTNNYRHGISFNFTYDTSVLNKKKG